MRAHQQLRSAGLSNDDVAEMCCFATKPSVKPPELLHSLRCLQLGPPQTPSREAGCFSDGAWQALFLLLSACSRLEVTLLWGASSAQADGWAAEMEDIRVSGEGSAAMLLCTPMAAPAEGVHVRLSRLPGCVLPAA